MFLFFEKRCWSLESDRLAFNTCCIILGRLFKITLIVFIKYWYNIECKTYVNICTYYFEKVSHIFLYLFCFLMQGSRINWGSVQPPSPSLDPWRWHHSPVWQTEIWGLWLIWGINSVLHGHEGNLILKISRTRISWTVLKVPDLWTSLGITQGTWFVE